MNEPKALLENITRTIGRMSASQVLMLLGVVAGSIVGAIALFNFFGSARNTPLFSDLDAKAAQDVVAYLDEHKIPYEIAAGGKTIEVSEDVVYKTRMALASQGLPSSGTVGYSIFDETNLGMTDFLQQVNYQRALEGELTRTIMEIGEVEAARVHLVLPKDRLFSKDKKEPSASVLLKTHGSGLTRRQLAGISHLVASSVEGLRTTNISIIDYEGNLLTSESGNDPLGGLSSTQLQTRKDVESYLEEKAQSMLDDVIGDGRAVVRITAELDFQQVERTNETYDPNLAAVRSEQRTEEVKSSSDKSDTAAESKDDNRVETTVTNYEIPKTLEHIVNAVGVIQRLSIAVMLDGVKQTTQTAEGKDTVAFVPRQQQEIDRLTAVVKSAVGFSVDRNDQVEVFNISFDRQDMDRERLELDKMSDRTLYYDLAKKVGFWVAVIAALLWFRSKARKLFGNLKNLMPPPAPQQSLASAISDEVMAAPSEKRRPKRLDVMQETAKERPEELAKVIKTMMVQ